MKDEKTSTVPKKHISFEKILGCMHSIYYLLTGLWPLMHIESFLMVTGEKIDIWLVKTVGILTLAIAIPIAQSTWNDSIGKETVLLGCMSTAGFICIDVNYVLHNTISPIYLADALPEFLLLLGWIIYSVRNKIQ